MMSTSTPRFLTKDDEQPVKLCSDIGADKLPENKRVYHKPGIKLLGTLRNLIMGASGIGIDSASRREF